MKSLDRQKRTSTVEGFRGYKNPFTGTLSPSPFGKGFSVFGTLAVEEGSKLQKILDAHPTIFRRIK